MNEQHVVTAVEESAVEIKKVTAPPITENPQSVADKQLDANCKVIDTCFKGVWMANLFGPQLAIYKNNYRGILDNFKALRRDETVCVSGKCAQDVRQTVNTLKRLVMDVPITEGFATFLEAWCNLVSNWNNNILHDQMLKVDCMMLERIARSHFTYLELFEFTKALLVEQKKLRTYALPSIELAKHYAKSMTGPGKPSEVPTAGPLLEPK